MAAVTASEKGRLMWRVTGQAMIQHFTMAGHVVALDKSETFSALLLTWWGIVVTPGGFSVSPVGLGALTAVMPPRYWAGLLLVLGGYQLAGISLAWLGLWKPHRLLRLTFLFLTTWFWFTLAFTLAFGGLTLGPAAYGMFGVMSLMNWSRVRRLPH